jgi:hypothetical protein
MKRIPHPLLWLTWMVAFIACAVLLTACGGGDDEDQPDPHVCYVDGKPMPARACQ